MYPIIYNIHHYVATLVFILLLTAVVFIYNIQGRPNSSQVKKISFFTLILTHTQVLLGIILLAVAVATNPVFSNMKELMGNGVLRQKYIEHPCTMIIVVILLTIVNIKIKKAEKITFAITLMTVISLALTIGMIPKSFWGTFIP